MAHPELLPDELSALYDDKTWKLTYLPAGRQALNTKWVYTLKFKADGSIERFKARLVATGYTQTQGVDYDQTISPLAKLNAVKIIISLHSIRNYIS